MNPITFDAPWLIFLGKAKDNLHAKTGHGLVDWRRAAAGSNHIRTPSSLQPNRPLGQPRTVPEMKLFARQTVLL